MKLIRNNVFETNSSSCHSISVGSSDVYEGISPNYDGTLEIYAQEFGWEQHVYSDVTDRLAYVSIYIRDWVQEPLKFIFKGMFDKVVMEHTGAERIEYVGTPCSWNESGYDMGCIDHQSVEDKNLDHLFKNEGTLKSFLFDKDSYIETDNDNH